MAIKSQAWHTELIPTLNDPSTNTSDSMDIYGMHTNGIVLWIQVSQLSGLSTEVRAT